MICQTCGEDGAGFRYRAWFFHAMCWERVRTFAFLLSRGDDFPRELTATGENADNGDAETTALTVAPANPLPAQGDERGQQALSECSEPTAGIQSLSV